MNSVTFHNGIEIALLFSGPQFLGLGQITAAGIPLRRGDVPIRPHIVTMDGIAFTDFVQPKVTREGSDVIIQARAIGRWQSPTEDMVSHWWPVRTGLDYLAPTETFEGELTWRLEPKNLEIGGTTFSGFVSRYAFKGPDGKFICRLEDRSTWGIGGSTDGNTLIERCYYTPEKHEVDLARGVDYSTSGRKKMDGFGGWAFQYSLRWGGSIAPFDFLFNEDGTLIRSFETPSYIRSWLLKRAGDDRLACFDDHFAEAAQRIETVGTYVGFAHAQVSWTRTDARNLWTAVMDYYNEQACEFARTRPKPIRPMMTLPNGLDHPLRHTADTLVEPAAQLGLKVLWLHPIWDSEMNRPGGYGNGCSVYDWTVAKELGGEEGLKYLADKVHQHGMLLIAWCGGIRQGWEHNAWVRENKHSEWLARYINNRQFGSGYDCMTSLDMNRDEAYRYVIETCRGVVERTGLDGFFWDSYVDAWEEVVSPWPLKMKPAFHRVVQLTAELQSFCRYFTVEAQPPWARPCVGNGIAGLSCLEGCHYANIGRYFGNIEADRPDIMDFYFRNLAYGAGSVMEWYEMPKILARPELARAFRQINHDFLAAQPDMGTRRLIEGDPGVEWISPDGQRGIFFSFSDGLFRSAAQGRDVRCLTTGETLTVRSDGSFVVKAHHVYQFTLSRGPTA